MCGIAGVINPTVSADDRASAVERMCEAMIHRGPDDAGVASMPEATLGMRRLAIFDPAHGHQPMRTPDGQLTLVFNGAIYNFRELRSELEAKGWSFHTQCDTEVLLAAYARWGADCVGRLRGMYAFAVWNQLDRSLFLARDPFGIKPLYYRHGGGAFQFASELNALVASRTFAAEIDVAAVVDYLGWLAVPAPRTIYRDIRSLQPGECLTYANGQVTLRSTWSFAPAGEAGVPCRTRDEFVRELRGRLEDSIRAHMLADVPVGAFLSGGLDSAVVAGLMTRATGSRLRTFSIGFDEADYSEVAAARETAEHLGTDHSSWVLRGRDVATDLDSILATLDQPTGDGINTFYVSRLARAGGVTVALSGLGGDELFGSYPSFRDLPRLNRWLPAWHTLPAALQRRIVDGLNRGDTRQRKLADFLAHARGLTELGALQRRVFSDSGRRTLLAPEARAVAERASPFHPQLPHLGPELERAGIFETISAWELRTYMADVLLRDSDVMSMRHSLELRVPFVDRPFIEWLWAQPAEFKFDRRRPKAALAEATQDILPPALLRRPKRGFTLPFAVWMKQDLRPFLDDTFSEPSVERSGLFDAAAVQQLWRGYLAQNDTREWSRVWSLAMLIAFLNRRNPTLAQPGPARVTPQPRPARPAPARRERTLLLAPEIFASEGGIPRILQLYLKALCDLAEPAGEVRLLALNDTAFDAERVRRHSGSALREMAGAGRSKLRFVRTALRMSRSSDRIVCGHVFMLPVAWLASRLNPRLRYYLIAHGIEVWRPFTPAERLALRGAEKILCVSDYTRRELLKHCPLPEGRTVVLPNALDPAFAIGPGRPLPECPPAILVVTRLTWDDRYKGVQHLIEALPAIRRAIPEATLRIIGRGDDLNRLRDLAQTRGVAEAVKFLGFVDDQRLSEEMKSCRLFALPSRKEGFGLVFLEAMAHGRPCLGARAGGIPEVISAETGVLVEYGDVPGIAAAAAAALQGNWNETSMLERAKHFSFAPFADRLAQLLDP